MNEGSIYEIHYEEYSHIVIYIGVLSEGPGFKYLEFADINGGTKCIDASDGFVATDAVIDDNYRDTLTLMYEIHKKERLIHEEITQREPPPLISRSSR